MTDEILALNSNDEVVAKDPATGNTRPIQISDLSASSRLNLDDGALLTLGSDDDFAMRYDATADSFVVTDNTNGVDTITVDRTTGDIDTTGDVSATNVSADTQMNSSSTRPDVFANTVNINSITSSEPIKSIRSVQPTDNLKIATVNDNADSARESMYTVIDQPNTPFTVHTGFINTGNNSCDWQYTFADGSTLNRNLGTGWDRGKRALSRTRQNGEKVNTGTLPPATNLIKVGVTGNLFNNSSLGAEVVYSDI